MEKFCSVVPLAPVTFTPKPGAKTRVELEPPMEILWAPLMLKEAELKKVLPAGRAKEAAPEDMAASSDACRAMAAGDGGSATAADMERARMRVSMAFLLSSSPPLSLLFLLSSSPLLPFPLLSLPPKNNK